MICWRSEFGIVSFEVQALQVLYTSLNSPSQLTGWKSTGGDPCGESWRGITCLGSAVVSMWVFNLCLAIRTQDYTFLVEMYPWGREGLFLKQYTDLCNDMYLCCFNSQIPGLGLGGTMGYMLSSLTSLRTLWENYWFSSLNGLATSLFHLISLHFSFLIIDIFSCFWSLFLLQRHEWQQHSWYNSISVTAKSYEPVMFTLLWNSRLFISPIIQLLRPMLILFLAGILLTTT